MRSIRVLLLGAAGLLLPALAASGAEIAGRLLLAEPGKAGAAATADPGRAAVWFEPAAAPASADAAKLRPVVAEMTTVKKQFSPQVLVVPVGSTVRFTNNDPILHNAFSVSGKNAFDSGLVGGGGVKEAVFREPGIVRVFCNVHHAMFAHVVVVDTPWSAQPDARGAFRIDGVPAGKGTLWYWHERAEPKSMPVTLPLAAPLDLKLVLDKPRVPPHKNKFGKTYSGGGYG